MLHKADRLITRALQRFKSLNDVLILLSVLRLDFIEFLKVWRDLLALHNLHLTWVRVFFIALVF